MSRESFIKNYEHRRCEPKLCPVLYIGVSSLHPKIPLLNSGERDLAATAICLIKRGGVNIGSECEVSNEKFTNHIVEIAGLE